MNDHLKQFANHSAYAAAESGLILPNVSLCVQENEVHYNPFVDPYAGHEYVEIGGLKWATMNVGASQPSDYGLYFQWGDTQGYAASQVGSGEGQKYFGWADYKYTNDGGSTMTKYTGTGSTGDGLTVLDASDDAVQAAWGGNWRMPTKEDFAALSAAVNTEWVTDYQGSGVNGRLMTDKTDSSKVLFFPACGAVFNGYVEDVSYNGDYWSSSLRSSDVQDAYYLSFYSDYVSWQYVNIRYSGCAVRGVAD